MGFLSTFTTVDANVDWPQWFRDKYAERVFVPSSDMGGVLHSKMEAKAYVTWADFEKDIQAAINWDALGMDRFVLVYLHECGGITRCQIERDAIKFSEPSGWDLVDDVSHHYCYGCSDV